MKFNTKKRNGKKPMTTTPKKMFKILVEAVVERSNLSDEQRELPIMCQWMIAKKQWYMWEHEIAANCDGVCTCTKNTLYHVYTIKNRITELFLEVGSRCIKHFHNPEMDMDVKIIESWGKRLVKHGKWEGLTYDMAIASSSFPSWFQCMTIGKYYTRKKNVLDLIQYYRTKKRLET